MKHIIRICIAIILVCAGIIIIQLFDLYHMVYGLNQSNSQTEQIIYQARMQHIMTQHFITPQQRWRQMQMIRAAQEAIPEPEPEPEVEIKVIASAPTTSAHEPETPVGAIAKVIYREARGVSSIMRQAAVAWCILNRVDAGAGDILSVCMAPNQFAYSYNTPTIDDYGRDLLALAEDVLSRWEREAAGETDVGRVLPKAFRYFSADPSGVDNIFRDNWKAPYTIWDWSLPNPYES